MNDKQTDEAYARAALTYLAEPADRWLSQLLRVHGAATTLDAIKAGHLPAAMSAAATSAAAVNGAATGAVFAGAAATSAAATSAATGRPAGSYLPERRPTGPLDETVRPYREASGGTVPGAPRGRTDQAMRAAMERWRVRLPELPAPEELLAFRESGIRLICPGDSEWPGQLTDLGDDQPYALWLRGNADLRFNCLRSVAIVGARAATAYGCYVAAEIAASVAARGLAVVSGGAYGIDAAAHRGALGADGVTIAVLACGVDVPYPVGHAELFDAVAAQGVIVSEWPPGRTVSRLRFLVRNRVIAALAAGTLVVEAGQRSGAVNTARHARDLDRRLMAVPGPITSEQSAGCHQVIREWQAILVTSAAEVLEVLPPVMAASEPSMPARDLVMPAGDPAMPARDSAAPAPDPAAPADVAGVPAISRAAAAGGRRQPPPVLDRDQLDLESMQVLDAMPARVGMGTTRIAQRAGLPPQTAVRCLGELASGGFVERCDEGWRLTRG